MFSDGIYRLPPPTASRLQHINILTLQANGFQTFETLGVLDLLTVLTARRPLYSIVESGKSHECCNAVKIRSKIENTKFVVKTGLPALTCLTIH